MNKSKFQRWPKRDPIKNCFLLPNEVFQLDLSGGAKLVYAYLLYVEDRKTYQCHPSYKTIGRHVGMSTNTVKKYVSELESKRLITTEQTMIITKDGRRRNGSLLYTILPIQVAVDYFYERQMEQLEETVEKQEAQGRLLAARPPQVPPSTAGPHPGPPPR